MSESRVRKYYLGREGVNEILKIISKETFIDSSIINLGQKYNDLESRDDISTIVNEAFEEYNCVFLPNGVYTITNPIEITGNFKKFYCLGEIKSSAAAAIKISGSYNDIYIKSIVSNVETKDDGFFDCAILLNNNNEEKYIYYNNIIVDKIVGSQSCFCFNPTVENSGIAYTNITFKEINGEYGIYFAGNNGFINENIFNGGVINCKYSIYIPESNNIKDPYNGNKFNHIALEGGPNRMYLNHFRYNHFNDCRFSTEENGWWRNNPEDETETGTFIEFGEGAWGNSFNFVGYVYSNFLKTDDYLKEESGTLPNYFYGFLAIKPNEDAGIIILGKKGYFIKEGLMIIKDEDRLDGDYTILNSSYNNLFNQEYAIEGYSYKIENVPSEGFVFRPPQGYFYSRALYFYINIDNIEQNGILSVKLKLDSVDYTLSELNEIGLYRITFNCAGRYYTEKLI